jgi:hypothetical protein
MDSKRKIHGWIGKISNELLEFIKDKEASYEDGWVPAAEIKNELGLKFDSTPREGKQYGEKGWFFAIIARILEDKDRVEYKKDGSRAFYRTKKNR